MRIPGNLEEDAEKARKEPKRLIWSDPKANLGEYFEPLPGPEPVILQIDDQQPLLTEQECESILEQAYPDGCKLVGVSLSPLDLRPWARHLQAHSDFGHVMNKHRDGNQGLRIHDAATTLHRLVQNQLEAAARPVAPGSGSSVEMILTLVPTRMRVSEPVVWHSRSCGVGRIVCSCERETL